MALLENAMTAREKVGSMRINELKGKIGSLKQETFELENALAGVIRPGTPSAEKAQVKPNSQIPLATEIEKMIDEIEQISWFVNDIKKRIEF